MSITFTTGTCTIPSKAGASGGGGGGSSAASSAAGGNSRKLFQASSDAGNRQALAHTYLQIVCTPAFCRTVGRP